jgi:hypothetical protein
MPGEINLRERGGDKGLKNREEENPRDGEHGKGLDQLQFVTQGHIQALGFLCPRF